MFANLVALCFYISLLLLINNGSKPNGSKPRNRNYLRSPVNISRIGNVTNIELRVKAHTQTIYGRDNKPIANITIRAYEYNGSTNFVGPTIHAHPGDLINITLINDLIGVGRQTQIDKLLGTSLNRVSYKDPDVTNIHLHGLHVDPNIDNIALWISPKCSRKIDRAYWDKLDCYINKTAEPKVINSRNYPYRIPLTHYPGTHWYHAHKHGSVTFDLMSGIYGLFIIDDILYPPPMIDIELLIGFMWLHGGDLCRDKILKPHNGLIQRNIQCTGTGRDNRPHEINGNVKYPFNFPIQSACFINCRMQYELKYPFIINGTKWTQLNASDIGIYPVNLYPNIPGGDGGENGRQYFLINGEIEPVIKINPIKWYHFRIVNTIMNYLLFWVANDITAKHCQFKVMGQDGIYFKNGARDLYSSPYQQRKVILQPGSRADLAVRCKCPINEAIDGICDHYIYAASKFLVPEIDKFVPLPLNDTLLFTLEVSASNASNHATWSPQPYSTTPYLSDTRNAKTNAFCSRGDYPNMTQCNFVQGREIYPAGKPRLQSLEAVNQETFNVTKVLAKVCTEDTHEWLVTNNFHPIHQHTWPFQIQRNLTSGWVAMDGDWRDTVGASGTIRIRSNYYTDDFSYKNYNFTEGIIVMHCHYVPHEDHGMMALIKGIKNCSSISGQYIVPININESNIFPNKTATPTITKCIPRNATSILHLNDVGCYINIKLIIYETCYFELHFIVIPRSESIGNLWIGLGVDGKNQSLIPLFNKTFPNYYTNMSGDALVISILANNYNKPLTQLTSEEVHLETRRRLAIVYKNNYFNCNNNFNSESGILSWKCIRPFCSICNEKFGKTWMALNDGDTNFAFAYGEGQFIPDTTYHSSKGGCRFIFGHTTYCNQTQFL